MFFESKASKSVWISDILSNEDDVLYLDGILKVNRKFQGDLEWLKTQVSQR